MSKKNDDKIQISDYELMGMIKQRLDKSDEVVGFSKEHKAMNNEDKFVDDFMVMALYVVKVMKLKDVVRFECDFDNPDAEPVFAVDKFGNKTELDFFKYIGFNTPAQEIYMNEALELQEKRGFNPYKIAEKINKQSEQFIKDNL